MLLLWALCGTLAHWYRRQRRALFVDFLDARRLWGGCMGVRRGKEGKTMAMIMTKGWWWGGSWRGEVTWNMLFRPILAPCGLHPVVILLIILGILTLSIIIISIIIKINSSKHEHHHHHPGAGMGRERSHWQSWSLKECILVLLRLFWVVDLGGEWC